MAAVFRVTATPDFPFAPLRVTCIDSEFCFPSLADGRDMIFDVLESEWYASCSFVEVINKLPSFAERVSYQSVVSPRSIVLGHFYGLYDIRHYLKNPSNIAFFVNKISIPKQPRPPMSPQVDLHQRIAILTESALIITTPIPKSADGSTLLPQVLSWRHLALIHSFSSREGLGVIELIFRAPNLPPSLESSPTVKRNPSMTQDIRMIIDFHPWNTSLQNHPAAHGYIVQNGKLRLPIHAKSGRNQPASTSSNLLSMHPLNQQPPLGMQPFEMPGAVFAAMPPPSPSIYPLPPTGPTSRPNSSSSSPSLIYAAPQNVQTQVVAFSKALSSRLDALGFKKTDQTLKEELEAIDREIERIKSKMRPMRPIEYSDSQSEIEPKNTSQNLLGSRMNILSLLKNLKRKVEVLSLIEDKEAETKAVLSDIRIWTEKLRSGETLPHDANISFTSELPHESYHPVSTTAAPLPPSVPSNSPLNQLISQSVPPSKPNLEDRMAEPSLQTSSQRKTSNGAILLDLTDEDEGISDVVEQVLDIAIDTNTSMNLAALNNNLQTSQDPEKSVSSANLSLIDLLDMEEEA
eukprot:GDKK01076623.1.p1 GENE.GDKK01076623.1~~GDKK01076623.1.p1  ORF type:complete len:642 (+),score=108.14 GDKK01076623.1:202-1926(+)